MTEHAPQDGPRPEDADVAAQKVRMREEALARRSEASRTAVGAAAAVAARAADVPPGAIVSGYIPIRDELDPRPLMDALRTGARIALPRIRERRMEFVAMGPGDRLVAGGFGLSEPSGGEIVVPDVLLVPLLAFTRQGARLGYGAGHYDRWLAEHPDSRTVGLAFAAQEVEALPLEAHDQPLDAILTERELIRVR